MAWLVELTLEHARLHNNAIYGHFMDREKYFDKLSWEVLYELEVAAGFPRKWTEADNKYNKNLKLAFRFGSSIAKWWQATNSFRQGTAGAVRGVTLLMAIWINRQIWVLPRALVANFFDYCIIITTDSKKNRQHSMDESDKFDKLTGQRVGHKKTVAFSAPAVPDDDPVSRGVKLKPVEVEKAVGILLQLHGKVDRSIHDKRFEQTKNMFNIISIFYSRMVLY